MNVSSLHAYIFSAHVHICTAGLWSLVTLNRSGPTANSTHSPLAKDSLLLLLVLTHQQARGHNPYRTAIGSFTDERGEKKESSFAVSLEKIYLTLCRYVKVICVFLVAFNLGLFACSFYLCSAVSIVYLHL